jgi:hypothetical protein
MELDDASSDEAYHRVLPEALGLPSNRVRAINVAVEKVIDLAMAAAKRIHAFEAELRAHQGFPVEQLERFGDYTLALYSAHLRYQFLVRPTERLPALNEAASRWRALLLSEAKTLVLRQLIKGERLRILAGHHGYRNVAKDLAGLAQIFKSEWEHLQGQTWLKMSDIEAVSQLALKLTGAISDRRQPKEQLEAAIEIQARMFTLLYHAYDEIRRGIHHLRWHQRDADEIVPSFYSRRWKSNGNTQSKSEPLTQAVFLAAATHTESVPSEVTVGQDSSVAVPVGVQPSLFVLPVSGQRVPGATPISSQASPPLRAASATRKTAARKRRRRAPSWRRHCEQNAFRACAVGAISEKRPNVCWKHEPGSPDWKTELGGARDAPEVPLRGQSQGLGVGFRHSVEHGASPEQHQRRNRDS